MGEDQQECDKCKANEGNALMGYPKNCVTEYGSCIEEAKPVIPCAVEKALGECQAQGCAAAKDPKGCMGENPSADCQGCLGCLGGKLNYGSWQNAQAKFKELLAGAGQHEELLEAP